MGGTDPEPGVRGDVSGAAPWRVRGVSLRLSEGGTAALGLAAYHRAHPGRRRRAASGRRNAFAVVAGLEPEGGQTVSGLPLGPGAGAGPQGEDEGTEEEDRGEAVKW